MGHLLLIGLRILANIAVIGTVYAVAKGITSDWFGKAVDFASKWSTPPELTGYYTSGATNAGAILASLNVIFPVPETVSMWAAYMAWLGVLAVYRHVRHTIGLLKIA